MTGCLENIRSCYPRGLMVPAATVRSRAVVQILAEQGRSRLTAAPKQVASSRQPTQQPGAVHMARTATARPAHGTATRTSRESARPQTTRIYSTKNDLPES